MSRGVLKMWLVLISPLLPSHWCFPQDIMAGRQEDIHIPDIPDRGFLSQFYAYFSDLSDGYLNEHRLRRNQNENDGRDQDQNENEQRVGDQLEERGRHEDGVQENEDQL